MARIRERLKNLADRLRGWVGGLSVAAVVLLALVAIGALSAAGVFMYRTYTFVEHDNQFCLSCHLMVDPYERFAQSAHRGLGCKACHQPTFVERSRMAVSQVLENPDEISTHAHVSNSACASCHIDGDPEQWRTIASAVGHRVHLESDDPSLSGLMCVECHSSSIHEFAASDRTCSQSGCHEDTRIVLGRMEPLTIHCVACHEFSRPVTGPLAGGAGQTELRPTRNECLTCHQMRVLVADMPEDEPHDQVCGACHNPHDQRTPREAERTCASAGCHTDPETVSPMHRGLAVGVLENCLGCHTAHDFRVRGDRCLDCHQDIFDDAPHRIGQVSARAAAEPRGAVPAPKRAAAPPGRLWSVVSAHLTSGDAAAPTRSVRFAQAGQAPRPQQQSRDPLVFSHGQHRGVECTACHSMERSHGTLTVTSARDCQSCHHAAPVANQCQNCHLPAARHPERYGVAQTLRLSVAPQPRTRNLPFNHVTHAGETCTTCHREPLTLRADVTCNSCHQEHHQPNTQCISCHVEPPGTAHNANAHLGCSGSGCHDPVPAPVRNVPRTRNFCLSCHQGLVQHEPGGNCADCHRLPAPRPRAALFGGEALAGGGR